MRYKGLINWCKINDFDGKDAKTKILRNLFNERRRIGFTERLRHFAFGTPGNCNVYPEMNRTCIDPYPFPDLSEWIVGIVI